MSIRTELAHLDRFCVAGVYAISNPKTKKVYLGYSENILISIGHIAMDMKVGRYKFRDMSKDRKSLNIEIVQICTKEESRLVMTSKLKEFISLGHIEYRKTPIAKLKVVTRLEITGVVPVVIVALRNSRGKDIVVGRFDTMDQANSFVSECYPTSEIVKIIYDKSVKT